VSSGSHRAITISCLGLCAAVLLGLSGCTSSISNQTDSHQKVVKIPDAQTQKPDVNSSSPAGGNTADQAALKSVSCFPTGGCVAIGNNYQTPFSPEVMETLTTANLNSEWVVASQPQTNALTSVSCVAGGDCMAIGPSQTGGTFQKWDGNTWTSLPALPNGAVDGGQPTYPSSLSCTSTVFCIAVGGNVYKQGNTGGTIPVIEMWNGQDWLPPVTPVSALPDGATLEDVSCVSRTFCMAVGKQHQGTQNLELAVEWDGSQWISGSLPGYTGSSTLQNSDAHLQSISCDSNTHCVALGTVDYVAAGQTSDNTQLIADIWNGSSWSSMPAPLPVAPDVAYAQPEVDCLGPSGCIAFWSSIWVSESQSGPTNPDGGFAATSQLWNGVDWTEIPLTTPDPNSQTFDIVNSLACSSQISCTAVGTTTDGSNQTTLVEYWNGSQWIQSQIPIVDAGSPPTTGPQS